VPPRGTMLQTQFRSTTIQRPFRPISPVRSPETYSNITQNTPRCCGRSVIFSDSATKIAQNMENSMVYQCDGESSGKESDSSELIKPDEKVTLTHHSPKAKSTGRGLHAGYA